VRYGQDCGTTTHPWLNPGIVDLEDFKAKSKEMKALHHPNLLKLYAVCTLEEPIYIVTELMKHGTLLDYLRKFRDRDLYGFLIWLPR